MIDNKLKDNALSLALMLAIFFGGFFLGRATVEGETTIEYVKGETITDTIRVPSKPDTIFYTRNPTLPRRIDTVYVEGEPKVIHVVDTPEVFRDYSAEKHFSFNLFDSEELGKVDVRQVLQYNAIKSVAYDHTPVTKTVTTVRDKTFRPFVSGSYISLGEGKYIGVGGGTHVRDIGIEYQYLTDGVGSGHLLSLKYSF